MLSPKYYAVVGAAIIGPVVTTAELAHGKEQHLHCHPEHRETVQIQNTSAYGSSMTTATYAIGFSGIKFTFK